MSSVIPSQKVQAQPLESRGWTASKDWLILVV